MIRSRVGWKVVGLILLFLGARAIGAVVLELRISGDSIAVPRIIGTVVWIVILVGIGCGLELARFTAVIFLTLGTAVGVAVLMDPQFNLWEDDLPDVHLLRGYLVFALATNLVVVPMLAFSKAVRGYFSKMPNHARPRY
jgi:signal transduction histidine kinase